MQQSIIDPNNVWIEAQSLVSIQLDHGPSKSQVLFWVSTREGFPPRTTADLDGDDAATGSSVTSVVMPDRSVAPSNNERSDATTKHLASYTSYGAITIVSGPRTYKNRHNPQNTKNQNCLTILSGKKILLFLPSTTPVA